MARVLTWQKHEQPRGASTLYPHEARLDMRLAPLTTEEAKAMGEFCHENFGYGGKLMTNVGQRWFFDPNRGIVAFRSEADLSYFVVAFSG